jgi:hypothetical protein
MCRQLDAVGAPRPDLRLLDVPPVHRQHSGRYVGCCVFSLLSFSTPPHSVCVLLLWCVAVLTAIIFNAGGSYVWALLIPALANAAMGVICYIWVPSYPADKHLELAHAHSRGEVVAHHDIAEPAVEELKAISIPEVSGSPLFVAFFGLIVDCVLLFVPKNRRCAFLEC